MSEACSIRPGSAGDLPHLLALYAQLNPQDPALEETVARATWARILATEGVTVLVVALPDGRLLATSTLIIVPNLSRGGRPYAIIENVVSEAAHRGKGYGKAVVQAAMHAARQAGCYKVALATGRSDTAVHRFYEAAGLTPGGKAYFEARWR